MVGSIAAACGSLQAGMVAVTVLLAVLMTETESPLMLVT
jgi:hypothetical protein